MKTTRNTSTSRKIAKLTKSLSAYEEAFWAMQRGETPVRLSSGDRSVELLGADRACGGVVVRGPDVTYANDWMKKIGNDPSLRDIANQIRNLQNPPVWCEVAKPSTAKRTAAKRG